MGDETKNNKFTQENRQSSLLDFSPLLREGARRVMKYASFYRRRFQLLSQSNTVVLSQTTWLKYSLSQLKGGGTMPIF